MEQRMKPRPTLSVRVKLPIHSYMHTFVTFSWTQRMLKSTSPGQTVNTLQEQGCHDFALDYGVQGACLKAQVRRDRKDSNPIAIYIYRVNWWETERKMNKVNKLENKPKWKWKKDKILCWAAMLTHWGRVTQICVFTLQLCKTDDANLRFFPLHITLNYAIHRACLRMVLLTDVYRNLTSLWINL